MNSSEAIGSGFVRVGFATSDDRTINEHFGRAHTFAIYDISKSEIKKIESLKFTAQEEPATENHADRHNKKISELSSCHIIYSSSIGGPVAARLTQNKIHPLVVKNNPMIMDTVKQFQEILRETLPPWLRRIVNGGPLLPTEDSNQCSCIS